MLLLRLHAAAVVLLLAITPSVMAVPITMTLSDPEVEVVFGGTAQTVDLQVVITADTANFQAGGLPGGSGYGNVLQTYTSAALGLAGVTGTELWDISIQFGGSQDSVILNDAGVFNGRGAIGFGGAISAWDGISALGPVGPAAGGVSNSPGNPTDVVGGLSLVLGFWDDGATFTATIGAASAPEPGIVALLALGLLGAGCARRRRVEAS